MRVLLDTHTLLWWFSDDPALPASCRRLIAQSESSSIFVSAVSAWEISTKFRLGKLPTASDLVQDFGGYLDRDGFQSLPLSPDHGIRAGLLPGPLKDPFDRMLIAQATTEKLFIVSNEELFDQYGVRRVW